MVPRGGGSQLRLACTLALVLVSPGWAQLPTAPSQPQAPAAPPARIATKIFAQQPIITQPRLSPDGKRLATKANIDGKESLAIIDLLGAPAKLIETGDVDLRWYRWAGNRVVLVSVGMSVPYFDETAYQTRLIAYELVTGEMRFLGGKTEGLIGDDVLWVDPEGKTLLLAYQKTIYDYPSVFSVDIATNAQTKVVGQRTNIWDWYADNQGVVRYGFGFSGSDRWQMVYRKSATDEFRTVIRANSSNEEAGYDAVRLIQGSDEGYVIRNNEETGRFALFRYNFATRQAGEIVLENPANDIADFDLAGDNQRLFAATYIDDRQRVHWFDPALKEIQDAFDKAVGKREAWIVSRSRDEKVLIVHVGSPSDPGAYYLYHQDDGVLRPFAKVNEQLPAARLAPVRYVRFTARDGLEIPAYLTLPPGRAPAGLPLIIMPHGGPYDIRDEGGFDPEVQFYANRGYAVLQPQFRGSGGYGKRFYEKGEGQWGRAMQDDLDDGMDWLVKEGTVDPKRVCIVGGSYGGFAALWGATRNPERYRCAASFAGISDLRRQLRYQLNFGISKKYRKDWRRKVQGAEDFDLRTVSPLYTIDRLKVPVLLMHGDKDQNVPYKQSKQMADALKAAGKPHEFYTLAGEGHGFSTSANQQSWFDRLDAFLAKHNPAD